MAQGSIIDFRLVSCAEEMQKSLEYGDEGERNTQHGMRKPDAFIVAWIGGSGSDVSRELTGIRD